MKRRGPYAAQPEVRIAAEAFKTGARATRLRCKAIAQMLCSTLCRAEQLRAGRYAPKANELAHMDPDDCASYLATVRHEMLGGRGDPLPSRDLSTEQTDRSRRPPKRADERVA